MARLDDDDIICTKCGMDFYAAAGDSEDGDEGEGADEFADRYHVAEDGSYDEECAAADLDHEPVSSADGKPCSHPARCVFGGVCRICKVSVAEVDHAQVP